SSRRRHTRFSRDWSSDVCSSDLRGPRSGADRSGRAVHGLPVRSLLFLPAGRPPERSDGLCVTFDIVYWGVLSRLVDRRSEPGVEIGRASCRGGGECWGGGATLRW